MKVSKIKLFTRPKEAVSNENIEKLKVNSIIISQEAIIEIQINFDFSILLGIRLLSLTNFEIVNPAEVKSAPTIFPLLSNSNTSANVFNKIITITNKKAYIIPYFLILISFFNFYP